MNETVMYAKYNQAGNRAIYSLLSKMSNDEREKDRGSYYGSLSGLVRHIVGGTWFFLDMFRPVLAGNAAATKAINSLPPMPPEGPLNESQWRDLGKTLEAVDAAYVAMAEALGEADLRLPLNTEWYGGNPAQVPLLFMISQLVVHNTHHRGQVSQILDSLKIDNDYSGIGVEFIRSGV